MNERGKYVDFTKEQRRTERQARNMARYAVRMARRGNVGTQIEPKTFPRLVPFVDVSVEPAVYERANDFLADNGLRIERHIEQHYVTVSENPRIIMVGTVPVPVMDHSQGPNHQVVVGETESMIIYEVSPAPGNE